MTDRPIIFSAPMVRALLDGRKTMTRRLLYGERKVKNGLVPASASRMVGHEPPFPRTPDYYFTLAGWQRAKAGDRLWVRENWGCPDADRPGVEGGRKPQAGDRIVRQADPADAYQWQTGHPGCADFCWRPSIHMPRWASRLTLIVTASKIERLQDMREADCIAEGAEIVQVHGNPVDDGPMVCLKDHVYGTPRTWFRELWGNINGAESWDANPEVVAITFSVQKQNIDAMEKAAWIPGAIRSMPAAI